MVMPIEDVASKLSIVEFRGNRAFDLCIKHKEDVFGWQLLAVIVIILTFGQVNLLKQSWTTIGNVVYVPIRVNKNGKILRYGDLPYTDYICMVHEMVHVEQFYKWRLKSMKYGRAAGDVLLILYYFFVFFPVGLAYGRYRIEREAFLEGLFAARAIGLEIPPLMERAIYHCSTSPWYLWMWPFPRSVRRWFETQYEARFRKKLPPSPSE
jgi:hypothetical protein